MKIPMNDRELRDIISALDLAVDYHERRSRLLRSRNGKRANANVAERCHKLACYLDGIRAGVEDGRFAK